MIGWPGIHNTLYLYIYYNNNLAQGTKATLISLGNIAHPSLSVPVEPRRPTKYNVSALYFSGGTLYV
jgi:hypothetical protein